MKSYAALIILATFFSTYKAFAKPSLLENVKNNPSEALSMCKRFRSLNSEGISIGSKEAIKEISLTKNLSETDAEILSIYVIGIHCPDVK
ncbi:hypothetical protein EV05_1492 [Prochlorococcus sp. MIT 0601]|nr:hypothetical protein EV05_1492 [Prochlorococcus sp. MIT 0601]